MVTTTNTQVPVSRCRPRQRWAGHPAAPLRHGTSAPPPRVPCPGGGGAVVALCVSSSTTTAVSLREVEAASRMCSFLCEALWSRWR